MKPHIKWSPIFRVWICVALLYGYGNTPQQAYDDYTRRLVRS